MDFFQGLCETGIVNRLELSRKPAGTDSKNICGIAAIFRYPRHCRGI